VRLRSDGETLDRRVPHTSLVELAHVAGHLDDHVNYLSLGGSKDWQLMAVISQSRTIRSSRTIVRIFLLSTGNNPCMLELLLLFLMSRPLCSGSFSEQS
jgi:hypothetical protein